jgi:hypothetical protein
MHPVTEVALVAYVGNAFMQPHLGAKAHLGMIMSLSMQTSIFQVCVVLKLCTSFGSSLSTYAVPPIPVLSSAGICIYRTGLTKTLACGLWSGQQMLMGALLSFILIPLYTQHI